MIELPPEFLNVLFMLLIVSPALPFEAAIPRQELANR